MTATSLEFKNNSPQLTLIVENGSDQTVSVYSNTLGYSCNSLNGFMVESGYLNTTVAPGKSATEIVSFSSSTLEALGIKQVAEMGLGLSVSSEARGGIDIKADPAFIKTSLFEEVDFSVDTYKEVMDAGLLSKLSGMIVDYRMEDVLFDQGGIRVIDGAIAKTADGEQALLLEVENTSDQMLAVLTSNFSSGGLTLYQGNWSAQYVGPGKRAILALSISDMMGKLEQEALGIESLPGVTLTLGVTDKKGSSLIASAPLGIGSYQDLPAMNGAGVELYNGNGIRVISKGFWEDELEYSDDVHILMLVENDSQVEVSVDVAYDSVSANSSMVNEITYGKTIAPGCVGVMDVVLTGSSLEKVGIKGIEDIQEAELTLEIHDGKYNAIAEPHLVISE